jgi:putative tricarboxylic transport membrane protein
MTTGGQSPDRRPDRAAVVIAAGLAVFGAVLIWDASAIPDKAGYSGVGADGMPRFVGLGMLVLSALTLLSAFRGPTARVEPQNLPALLWIVAGMLAVIFLVHPLGFTIALGALFACTATAFGKTNFAVTVPVGLLFALAVYGVFDQILRLNLPAGLPEMMIFGS